MRDPRRWTSRVGCIDIAPQRSASVSFGLYPEHIDIAPQRSASVSFGLYPEHFAEMSDIELTTNPNSNSLVLSDNSVKLLSPAGAASYKRRRVYDKVNSRIRTCDHVINTAVNSVRFSNDGKNIVTAGEDLNIVIWDVASGKQINKISICDGSEDSRGITFACFSPDGRTIACCRDDIALVLSVDDSNAEGAKEFEHKNDVTCISFSPDGRFLATGCKDKFARIYDLEIEPDLEVQSDEGTVWKSSQFGNGVSCISFSFDGKTLAVGCDDATLRNFDFQRDVDPVEKWKKTLYSWITCVSFSPMGNIMAAGTDCYVHFLDVVSGKDVLDCLVHDSRVTSSCFSPDGRCIVTGCSSGSCRFYDVSSGIQIHEIHHRDTVTSVSFFPSFFPDRNDVLMNSPLRVATSCDDSVARIYDVGVDPESTWVHPHKDFIQSLCFSPDERTIATGCDDCFVRIFDVDNGEELKSIKLETIVTTVCFSPDGTMIAAACEDDFIHLFNVDSCKLINKFENNEKRSTISFSPDSKNVATIYNKFCIIFNVSSGKEILKLEHEHYVTTACFSPDGQHIATGSYISHNDDACYARVFFHAFVPEKTSKKKKPATFKPILKLPHQDTVTSINFSSDGKWLVTGCEDQYARIFDAEIPTTSEKIRKAIKRFEHGDTVNSVRFSSDGRSIYTNCDDPYARVFIIEGMDKDDEEEIEVEDDEQNDDDEENENEEGEKIEDDEEENLDEGSDDTIYAFAASRFAVSSRHSIAYTDGNSLYVMPCPHDFAADASLPVFSDFALLWSRCNGKLVEAGGISDSHVVLSEFFAPNGGGLVAIASKWQDYDFPDALDTLVRLFDGDQPVVNASLILSKLLQVNDPDKDMPNAVAIKALLGNISRNPIVAARDNDLTQQLARVLTEFPSIASVVGEFWCGEDIKFELAPSHSIVMDESDPVTSIESVRMSVSFSESVRMYVAGSDSVNVPVFKSHFEKRPQVSGLALEYEHLILPLPNASAHRDGSDHKQTLMEALVETGNIDVFGSVPVRAIVQYKWETYGFVSWLKQFFRYCFGLALLVALSILTWQFWEPRRENHDGPQRENQDALFAATVVLSILYSIEILYFASREFRQFMHGIQGDGGLFERLKKSDQLDDPWNWLDLLHIIFGICSCILVWARSEKSLPVLAVTSFLRWWGILFYLQAFDKSGPYVRMLFEIVKTIKWFMAVMFLSILATWNTFLLLLKRQCGDSDAESTCESPRDANSVFRMMFDMVNTLLFGSGDLETLEHTDYFGLVVAIFIISMIALPIVLLNMLIAIMGDSYELIQDQSVKVSVMMKANSLLEMELFMSESERKNSTFFPKFLHVVVPKGEAKAGPDEYQGLMNAVKRHVDSSVQKLETKSAEHQAALKTEFEVLKKQNAQLVKQNSEMLKMLKFLRSKT